MLSLPHNFMGIEKLGRMECSTTPVTKGTIGKSRIISEETVFTLFLHPTELHQLLPPSSEVLCSSSSDFRAELKLNVMFLMMFNIYLLNLFSNCTVNLIQGDSFCLLPLAQYSAFPSKQSQSVFLNLFRQLRS